jgi:hypothetical protein
MTEKKYGNLVIGNIDRSAGECLRFRYNESGSWFEYVPPQYTGENVKIFKLDNPAVVKMLIQMLEG